MSKTLKQAKVGETVTVQRLQGEGPVKRRIMDMGITKGASIFVRKVAPLGDPIEVTVRGYELSLRKDDAGLILVDYHLILPSGGTNLGPYLSPFFSAKWLAFANYSKEES